MIGGDFHSLSRLTVVHRCNASGARHCQSQDRITRLYLSGDCEQRAFDVCSRGRRDLGFCALHVVVSVSLPSAAQRRGSLFFPIHTDVARTQARSFNVFSVPPCSCSSAAIFCAHHVGQSEVAEGRCEHKSDWMIDILLDVSKYCGQISADDCRIFIF